MSTDAVSLLTVENNGEDQMTTESVEDALERSGSFGELLEELRQRDGYEGYGYMGERQRFLLPEDPELIEEMSLEDRADIVTQADMQVYVSMELAKYDLDEAFDWLNSKDGRWFADSVFGSLGAPFEDYEKYLPAKKR